MILLTGGTGVVGSAVLPMLLAEGHEVRCLVRDPRKLGPDRVRVQLSLADLGDPRGLRHAVRGVDTVIHLAAAMRDQPPRKVEEITALGTHRLISAAEQAGVRRFIFFSALGATTFQRTRFFRSKALAEERVQPLAARDDDLRPVDHLRPRRHLGHLDEAAGAAAAAADLRVAARPATSRSGRRTSPGPCSPPSTAPPGRFELAGPERLTYEQQARLIAASAGRERPSIHVPLPFVRSALIWLRRIFGDVAFATWEEAELLEVPMISERGTADVKGLGVDPVPMRAVLGG